MNNYDSPGESVEFAAPATVLSGKGMLVGSIVGIATVDALITERLSVFIGPGVVKVDKVSAQAWTEGLKIYWDNTAKLFTSVVGTNVLAGVATRVAANPTATGYVRLDGVAR